MFNRSLWLAIWTVACTLIIIAIPLDKTLAYLDPGSGSLIIQIIIGGLLGLMVAARLYWGRIISFVTGKSKKPTESSDSIPTNSDQNPTDNQP